MKLLSINVDLPFPGEGEDAPSDEIALNPAKPETINGYRHPTSAHIIVPKLPKKGDTLVIDWSSVPAVKIEATVTEAGDGLYTIKITKVQGPGPDVGSTHTVFVTQK
jgi:hypothetical protein